MKTWDKTWIIRYIDETWWWTKLSKLTNQNLKQLCLNEPNESMTCKCFALLRVLSLHRSFHVRYKGDCRCPKMYRLYFSLYFWTINILLFRVLIDHRHLQALNYYFFISENLQCLKKNRDTTWRTPCCHWRTLLSILSLVVRFRPFLPQCISDPWPRVDYPVRVNNHWPTQ